MILVGLFVLRGVGINFRPRPRRDRRLSGVFIVVVKLWKARLVGRLK